MYVSRIRLTDIKGFSGPRTVDLDLTRPDGSHAGWTVLAGRNGSGKTSMLRAIALAICGPEMAFNMIGYQNNWVSAGADEGRAILSIVPDADSDRWPDTSARPPIPIGLTWGSDPTLTPGPVSDAFTDADVSSPPLGPWYDRAGWFCAGYGPFRRAAGRDDAVRLPRAARLATLFHEDAAMSRGVTWLIDQHLRELEGRAGAGELKNAALRILSDDLLPDGYTIDTVDADGLWVVRHGRRFPLREMSDGYRTVTGLVLDLLKHLHETFGALPWTEAGGVLAVTATGIVLIDEVDAHLHISWQKRIGSWMKAHFPRIQFIVSTHSPYICQDADPGGLVRLPGPDEQAKPQVVSQDLYERVVYGSGDDAAVSELFGIDTPYSAAAERLRSRLVTLEIGVVENTATAEQLAEYRRLKRLLTSSTVARADEVAARLRPRP